jgi:signal transduction histidine kinase
MSIIGHDLRTPITSILALLELFGEYDMSMEDFKTLLPDIRKNAESTGQLVINLLDWTQSQMSGLKVNRETLTLREIAESVIEDNHHGFDVKSNTVVNDLPAGKTHQADRRMVEFLFRNLLLNANKFTSKGTIRIYETSLGIHIADTGVGISPERQNTLFDWETRSNTPGTNAERGSGLGLPMCHEFVVAHGGQISIESTLGQGTTVTFTLK